MRRACTDGIRSKAHSTTRPDGQEWQAGAIVRVVGVFPVGGRARGPQTGFLCVLEATATAMSKQDDPDYVGVALLAVAERLGDWRGVAGGMETCHLDSVSVVGKRPSWLTGWLVRVRGPGWLERDGVVVTRLAADEPVLLRTPSPDGLTWHGGYKGSASQPQ